MGNFTEQNASKKEPKKNKKINGLIILGIMLFVTFIASYRPDVPSIHCDEKSLTLNPEVIMFGTWWCPYCYQARQYFHNNNINYCEYDIEKSDIGKKRYDEMKATAIPAMLIGKYILQGFSETNIEEALTRTRESNESSH